MATQNENKITIYTKEALDAIERRMEEYDDEESFLIGVGAIHYVKYPRYPVKIRSATVVDVLKGTSEPITGCIFETDVPYVLYRKLIDAVMERSRKREYAKQKQAEHLEKQML